MPDLHILLIAEPAILAAYVVVGIVGFGSTLVSAPVLAHVIPIATIVPALALTDLFSSWSRGTGLRAHVDSAELRRLVPAVLLGTCLGTWALLTVPAVGLMLLLGIFVIGYAANGMRSHKIQPPLAPRWAWWYGAAGGVLSAMFGAGGWVYSAYLVRRLDDTQQIRATQNAVLSLTSLLRVALFTLAGRYFDIALWLLVLCILPAVALGLYIGHRISLKLDRHRFLQTLYFVLILTGGSLIWRAWSLS